MWQVPGSNLKPETTVARDVRDFLSFLQRMLKHCLKTALSRRFSHPSEYAIHNHTHTIQRFIIYEAEKSTVQLTDQTTISLPSQSTQ
jgi:hypothetical protein